MNEIFYSTEKITAGSYLVLYPYSWVVLINLEKWNYEMVNEKRFYYFNVKYDDLSFCLSLLMLF